MSDLEFRVLLTRTSLGLDDLNINDHLNYIIAPDSFGGQVTWSRTTTGSVFMDDEITLFRKRSKIQEPLKIEVFGATGYDVNVNMNALIAAATQDTYDIKIIVDGVPHTYACEAADYAMTWAGPRFIARQVQVSLTVPRSPIPKVNVL